MTASITTQAGLEEAWLEAYYVQQLWVAINLELTDSTAGSMSDTVATKV